MAHGIHGLSRFPKEVVESLVLALCPSGYLLVGGFVSPGGSGKSRRSKLHKCPGLPLASFGFTFHSCFCLAFPFLGVFVGLVCSGYDAAILACDLGRGVQLSKSGHVRKAGHIFMKWPGFYM